jgi:hypothetical protein
MAPRIRMSRNSSRKPPGLDRWHFYPGEVARILRLEGLDYRQLRMLFRIIRQQAGSTDPLGRGWSRFTFRDLVALKTALLLAGGEEALAAGRRLRLQDLQEVCRRLREDLGLVSPLTEIAFRRRGRTIVAQVHGLLFEPLSGQLLLAEVESAVEDYLNEHPTNLTPGEKEELRARLRSDVQEVRKATFKPQQSKARVEIRF